MKRRDRNTRPRPGAAPGLAAASAAFLDAAARGDFASASAALATLVAAEPENASLNYNHALALRLSGRPVEALAAARRARGLDPANAKILFEIAASALEAGEPAASLEAGAAYLERHPGDADAALNAARAALLLDRPSAALALLDTVREGDAGDPHLLCRGEALRDLGRFEEAEAAWAGLPAGLAGLVLSLRSKGPRGRLTLTLPRPSP
ncbi:tetratricopeptide repeat protein [Jiella sonneratiae]|uniref:Tetratricopeptide repeat protein n=1 Tax=Jiella sonneratiae TaxID=2816856 RepID=A0ABS3J8Z5_9HYPH|nr:tetratricopeptide repeat protein [Jiella sonneratiae]MBO0906144.1 tetratricopeptide repeat protein [Jiella sonneratiae]